MGKESYEDILKQLLDDLPNDNPAKMKALERLREQEKTKIMLGKLADGEYENWNNSRI